MNTLDGNYDDYVNAVKNAAAGTSQQVRAEKKPNEYMLRKEREREERRKASRLKKIEAELDGLNSRSEQIAALLQSPEIASDYEKITELTKELDAVNAQREELENEWLTLSE